MTASAAVQHDPRATTHSKWLVLGAGEVEAFAFEAETISYFVDAAGLLGVPPSVAAIYGLIFSSPKPLNFSEIEKRLTISKGSVSQGLRALREIGAVKLAASQDHNKGPGMKLDYYEPDMGLRKLLQHFLENRVQAQLDIADKRLARIEKCIPTGVTGEAKALRERARSLSGWHRKTRALLPLIRSALLLVPKK